MPAMFSRLGSQLSDRQGYGTDPLMMPFRSRLGLTNQVTSALGGSPPRPAPIDAGPLGNYPVNAPIQQHGFVNPTPDQRMQGLLGTRRFQAAPFTGDTPIGGTYTARSGNEANVVRLPNGTVRVTGTNQYAGPTTDQLQRQKVAQQRRQQTADFRTLARARKNGLDPRYAPAVWQAAQRQGITLPQMNSSRTAAVALERSRQDLAPGPWLPPIGPVDYSSGGQQQPIFQHELDRALTQARIDQQRQAALPAPNVRLGPSRAYQGMGGLMPR